MPKETFLNLSPGRQKNMVEHLLSHFYDRHISQVKVSEIIETLGISRGAFYKYFTDLEDAYSYTVKQYANRIHGDIIASINQNKQDFFLGIENYLAWCGQLAHDSNYWRAIRLLTTANDLSRFKRPFVPQDSPMVIEWLELLKLNHFAMASPDEAIRFLYFVMALVINALTDYMANEWTAEELVEDFRYKVKWLKIGIKSKTDS